MNNTALCYLREYKPSILQHPMLVLWQYIYIASMYFHLSFHIILTVHLQCVFSIFLSFVTLCVSVSKAPTVQ